MSYWETKCERFRLLQGDCIETMRRLPANYVDLIFADPPYFLSTEDGSTCKSGKRVAVDKGEWDRPKDLRSMHAWNGAWLSAAKRVLRPHGTIWVCGTMHNIHSATLAMQQLSMHLINEVIWEKPNPPPNLACRTITHSHETIVWARKAASSSHHFDYEYGKKLTGKQLKDVWRMTAPGKAEKTEGSHPTQKPLALVARCIHLSLPDGGLVLDPFNGSGTTGVAIAGTSPERRYRYLGIDLSDEYLALSRRRIMAEAPELEDNSGGSACLQAPRKRTTKA